MMNRQKEYKQGSPKDRVSAQNVIDIDEQDIQHLPENMQFYLRFQNQLCLSRFNLLNIEKTPRNKKQPTKTFNEVKANEEGEEVEQEKERFNTPPRLDFAGQEGGNNLESARISSFTSEEWDIEDENDGSKSKRSMRREGTMNNVVMGHWKEPNQ